MTETKLPATKSNLMRLQSQLDLMNDGYDILDKKRKALLQQYYLKIEERNKVNETVNKSISTVKKALKRSIILIGKENVKSIAGSIPIDNSIQLEETKFMQTLMYKISFEKSKLQLSYSFDNTNAAFDNALILLNDLKEKIYKLAELDTTINNLDKEIQNTSKKVNSLEKVQIPKYQRMIKTINADLEEKEREEFSKTKIVKENKAKKANKL
ncbi:MAG: V-type ATP synthase subunit D [Tissierellia bacterium]|nr:V-type ATP synthase subunit D [Tissierellia bacterium]